MFCLVSGTLCRTAGGLCICRDLGIDKSRQRLAEVNNNNIIIKISSFNVEANSWIKKIMIKWKIVNRIEWNENHVKDYRACWETSLDWSCFAEWRINRKKNDWKTYDRQQNITNVRRSLWEQQLDYEVLKIGQRKTSEWRECTRNKVLNLLHSRQLKKKISVGLHASSYMIQEVWEALYLYALSADSAGQGRSPGYKRILAYFQVQQYGCCWLLTTA